MKLRRPCSSCPWRVDAKRGHWADDHFESIFHTCQDDGTGLMACHKTRGNFLPCQGWIRVLGFDAIGVRILAMQGRVTLDEVNDKGGPELFASFVAMLRANRIPIPKRNRAFDR